MVAKKSEKNKNINDDPNLSSGTGANSSTKRKNPRGKQRGTKGNGRKKEDNLSSVTETLDF
jgi:hypothetical protein